MKSVFGAIRDMVILMNGMWITFVHLALHRKVTTKYPDVPAHYNRNFRGEHRLKKDEKGFPKCVACFMCATACPSNCITIVAVPYEEWSYRDKFPKDPDREKIPQVFTIDMMKCIYCGMCEEACPCDAIELTNEHYKPSTTREEKVYDIVKLLSR